MGTHSVLDITCDLNFNDAYQSLVYVLTVLHAVLPKMEYEVCSFCLSIFANIMIWNVVALCALSKRFLDLKRLDTLMWRVKNVLTPEIYSTVKAFSCKARKFLTFAEDSLGTATAKFKLRCAMHISFREVVHLLCFRE